jgi:hypothetical protein
MFNTKFIEIAEGIEPGDRVLLSPPFNSQEKDLGGALLTAEEKSKLNATNAAVRRVRSSGGTPNAPLKTSAGAEVQAETGPGGTRPESTRLRALAGSKREELFKRFDKDGDGKLSQEELTAMRASLGDAQGGSETADGVRPPRSGTSGRDVGRPETAPRKGSGEPGSS